MTLTKTQRLGLITMILSASFLSASYVVKDGFGVFLNMTLFCIGAFKFVAEAH